MYVAYYGASSSKDNLILQKHQKGKKNKVVQEKNKHKRFEKHTFSFHPVNVEGLSDAVEKEGESGDSSASREENISNSEEIERKKKEMAGALMQKKQNVKGKKGTKKGERVERVRSRNQEIEKKRQEKEEKETAAKCLKEHQKNQRERERKEKEKQEEEARLEEEILLSVIRM